jgi:hypothetical protein
VCGRKAERVKREGRRIKIKIKSRGQRERVSEGLIFDREG